MARQHAAYGMAYARRWQHRVASRDGSNWRSMAANASGVMAACVKMAKRHRGGMAAAAPAGIARRRQMAHIGGHGIAYGVAASTSAGGVKPHSVSISSSSAGSGARGANAAARHIADGKRRGVNKTPTARKIAVANEAAIKITPRNKRGAACLSYQRARHRAQRRHQHHRRTHGAGVCAPHFGIARAAAVMASASASRSALAVTHSRRALAASAAALGKTRDQRRMAQRKPASMAPWLASQWRHRDGRAAA